MQLYFLPALFLIRCLGPALRPLGSGSAWNSAVVTFAWIAVYPFLGISLGNDPVTNALSGLRFYLLGMTLSRLRILVTEHAGPILVASALLMLAQKLGWIPGGRYPVYQLSYLIGAHLVSLLLSQRVDWLARLGRQTMGIYLLHAPPVLKAVQIVVSRLPVGWFERFLVIWLLTLLVALGLTRLITRLGWGRFLFGES